MAEFDFDLIFPYMEERIFVSIMQVDTYSVIEDIIYHIQGDLVYINLN